MDLYTIAKANVADYQRTADAMSLRRTAERLFAEPPAAKPVRDVPHMYPAPPEPMPKPY